MSFLDGGGACGALIAEHDWSRTELGELARWPASLTATVANMLHTRQPMLLFWGPQLIQFYNDAFVPSFGQGKHPTAMGQPARECWTDAWPVIGAQIEAVMSRGEPAWHEGALIPIHRNGRMEEVFWTYSYSPAFDDHGQVHGTLVIVTEITKRVVTARRLEALAHLSVALLAAASRTAAFEALRELAARWPADLPFVFSRGRSGEVDLVAGIAHAEAVAAAAGLAPPADRTPHPIALAGPAGSVWPEPIRSALECTVGAAHDVLVFGLSPRLPLDDGYRSFVVQICELLTSTLLRVETTNAALAIQRQRDNLLLSAPVAAALLVGPEHVYEVANSLYCTLVGRDPLGKSYHDAFPELRGTALPGILTRVYQTGEPFVVREMLVPLDVRGTGIEDHYFTFNLEPVRDAHDQIYGMMVIAVEITEQVRARHTLEKVGEERERILSELQDANRTKDEFLAMLGHELRNPLAPIVTALELMHSEGDATVGTHERALAVIERQVRHVVRLVDDLLDISRITRGMTQLDKQVFDLCEIVAAAVEMSASLVEQRGHRLEVDVPPGLLVDGDQARLVQVLSNLLTNAARYTPHGGAIRLSATADRDELVLTITDNGCGIAPDLLPVIFRSFVQGARSFDRAQGGLGLAIAKNLVELHGGSISAESAGLDRGATFRVRLPRAERPAAQPPRLIERAGAEPKRRILVVDDNQDAADLLGELVRMNGHEVTVVHDPASALAVIGTVRPEIAVLDIGLPGMDGYELASHLRAQLPACRLIALTGYGQATDRARATAAGFAVHLVKPVNLDQLLELLASE